MARPTKCTDEAMDNARHYLANYKEEPYSDVFPSIAGLSLVLKVARKTIHEWVKDDKNAEFRNIYEELMACQEKTIANGAISGVLNAQISKLMLTKHGYSDKLETDQNINLTTHEENLDLLK